MVEKIKFNIKNNVLCIQFDNSCFIEGSGIVVSSSQNILLVQQMMNIHIQTLILFYSNIFKYIKKIMSLIFIKVSNL